MLEWAASLAGKYSDVRYLGGAGDRGRDVIGIVDEETWDNFQCKHYESALQPNHVTVEIGKLLYFTHTGALTAPRRYVFVAPRGCGTSLTQLLDDPDALRRDVVDNWDTRCRRDITKTSEVPLDDALAEHVAQFPFEIFSSLAPLTLIDEHRTTPWHVPRFGGGLPARPAPPTPPEAVSAGESTYVRQLLRAYAEHLGAPLTEPDHLDAFPRQRDHLVRARQAFFSAEGLRTFSRDYLPPESFGDLQDQIYDGIHDVLRDEHKDGFVRTVATVAEARRLALDGHPLNLSMRVPDRAGVCHQLVNEDRFNWVDTP